jgi:secretion/DNA translocation related TadE-like protein
MPGAALVLGVTVTAALSGATLIASSAILVESQRVTAAADASALAGGDTVLGWVGGDPCTVAARVAEANGARLIHCVVEGLEIVVTTSGAILGMAIERRARAGPPRS